MNIVVDEIRIDENGRKFKYTEYDKKLDDGTPYSVITYLPSEEEIAEQQKQSRITELEQIIDRKLRLGDNVDTERAELRELYGL